jgi:hypothetical protein
MVNPFIDRVSGPKLVHFWFISGAIIASYSQKITRSSISICRQSCKYQKSQSLYPAIQSSWPKEFYQSFPTLLNVSLCLCSILSHRHVSLPFSGIVSIGASCSVLPRRKQLGEKMYQERICYLRSHRPLIQSRARLDLVRVNSLSFLSKYYNNLFLRKMNAACGCKLELDGSDIGVINVNNHYFVEYGLLFQFMRQYGCDGRPLVEFYRSLSDWLER